MAAAAAAAGGVNAALEGMGIRVRGEWLDACLAQLPPPPPGPPPQREQWVLAQVYERFLHSDLNASGRGGAFPPDLGDRQGDHVLQGTHVLQVDAIKNISLPAETREKPTGPGAGRCLLLALTDGARRAVGMEYAPVPELRVDLPPGVKVAVLNGRVREGVLLLARESIQVLGGHNGQQQQEPQAGTGTGAGADHPPRSPAGGGGGAGGGRQQQHQQQQRQPPGQNPGAPPAPAAFDPYDDPAIDWDQIDIPDTAHRQQRPPQAQPQPKPQPQPQAQQRPPPRPQAQPLAYMQPSEEDEAVMLAMAAAMDEWEAEAAAAASASTSNNFTSRKRPRPSSPLATTAPATATATGTAASSPAAPGSVVLLPSQSQCSTQASGLAASASSASAPPLPLPPLSSLRDEAREGPFVRLAERHRFPGQTVRTQAAVVRTVSMATNKRTPLRVVVEVDDGSGGAPLPARLDSALLERLLAGSGAWGGEDGLTLPGFRALFEQDRARAQRVLAGVAAAVYRMEGAMTLRLPAAGTGPGGTGVASQDGGGAGAGAGSQPKQATAVIVSCEEPTWADIRAMVALAGARVGVGTQGPSSSSSSSSSASSEVQRRRDDADLIILSE